MTVIYKDVEVEVDLDDFDTDELVRELKSRKQVGFNLFDMGFSHNYNTNVKSLVEKIYQNRREGRDYQALLDELLYDLLGKIV